MSSGHAGPPSSPGPPDDGSFASQLRKHYGEIVSAERDLESKAGPPGETQLASELLERLSGHAFAGSRYKLLGEVARGGMGAIFKVWDEDLRRTLAMKVMLAAPGGVGGGAADPRMVARFLEEAQVTGQLDHPGIVPLHELGIDAEGRVFFTMRLVRGRDLKSIFDLVHEGKEGWNETRALHVMLKVCEAMAYSHMKGVLHRDLKPANVMVGGFGEVYVMDWGLARVLGKRDRHDIRLRTEAPSLLTSIKTERRDERESAPDSPLVTMDGDVMGTPCYMSPEQSRGELDRVGPRSDVYSAGAMLYQLLTRQMPYVPPKVQISNRAVLARLQDGPPARIQTIRKDVPPELVAIAEKAMAREPEQRYPDMLAMADDLRAFLEHRVVKAWQTGAGAELKKWIERNRGMAAAIAVAILALVVGLVTSSRLYLRAEQKSADVLRLSALQELDDLVAEADVLWPPVPARTAAMESWLGRARELLSGLDGHRALLAELRSRALPESAGEEAASRATHPRAALLSERRNDLEQNIGRKEARELGPSLAGVLPPMPDPNELDLDPAIARDAKRLGTLAWELVDPERSKTGGEARGLALARLAVSLAGPSEIGRARKTLAWALCTNGFDDLALVEIERALEEAPKDQIAVWQEAQRLIGERVRAWKGTAGRDRSRQSIEALQAEVAALEMEVEQRHRWAFEDPDEQWWHGQLSKLVAGLAELSDPATGLLGEGVSPLHGWAVGRRLEFAKTIEERSTSGEFARARWAEAVASIRDPTRCPRYKGLAIEPQVGLLPIHRDPDSGLWEFAHLASGEPAEEDESGQLAITAETGIVLVLIPGGRFQMGAQGLDPSEPNYDPYAETEESPVHEVSLEPYFVAKYEMTQAQWQRVAGTNPSWGKTKFKTAGSPGSETHPVESVSWDDCEQILGRIELGFPTEAQWEHAARAGTSTPWWTGENGESLEDCANIGDSSAQRLTGERAELYDVEIDDGVGLHARVGRYRANPFGLHDVHGNVAEWCRERNASYTIPASGPGGERVSQAYTDRVLRGGGFLDRAIASRSALRQYSKPDQRSNQIGVRPARALIR